MPQRLRPTVLRARTTLVVLLCGQPYRPWSRRYGGCRCADCLASYDL